MTKNGLSIKTITTKRRDFQVDCVLLLGQLTGEKEKTKPLHFFYISLSQPHIGTFCFAPTHEQEAIASQNQ